MNNQAGSNCSDAGPAIARAAVVHVHPDQLARRIRPGDKILLAKGATWNQQMNLSGTGTIQRNIGQRIWQRRQPQDQSKRFVDDRGIKLVDGDYWSFSHLEVANAASGILAFYDTTGHNGLSFTDIYVHDINGVIYYKAQHRGSGSERDS